MIQIPFFNSCVLLKHTDVKHLNIMIYFYLSLFNSKKIYDILLNFNQLYFFNVLDNRLFAPKKNMNRFYFSNKYVRHIYVEIVIEHVHW